jgi:hypothetical protein
VLLARIPIAETEYAVKVLAARTEKFPLRDAVEITVVTRGGELANHQRCTGASSR